MTQTLISNALPLLNQGSDHWGHPWWPLWLLLWGALIGTAAWLIARRRYRRTGPDEPQTPPKGASPHG